MSLLRRLLGRDDQFYQLLEASAAEASAAAAILVRILDRIGKGAVDDIMTELAQSRRKHKRISQEVTELLCRQFVTPIEREDIEELSSSLYKISKNIEKIGERLTIAPPGADLATLVPQVSLLEQGANVVIVMVRELRDGRHGEHVKDSYERLQAIESEADRLMNGLLREIYRGEADGRSLIFWKDIYELLEKGIDRCRDSGYVVFHVVLKNS